MFLGLDISKNTLDVTLLSDAPKPRHKVLANTAAGHQQLLKWLNGHTAVPVHACLEATGTWGEAIALALHQAGHQVSVVNPLLIRGFSQSQLSRTKTDKADSANCALLPDAPAAALEST
jgi:transposase